MKRKLALTITNTLAVLLFILFLSLAVLGQERVADDPEDEADLNRELWEFASHTPYEEMLSYVAALQSQARASVKAEVDLPNGWRIAPAGIQVPVGRLPYQSILFAGKLVVLNTGYYFKESQEISIIDPATAEVVKTIKLSSLFPSARIGADGDLYISGGFDEKVFRLNKDFQVVREYLVAGHAGGLAAIDATHLAVGYLSKKDASGAYGGGKLALLNTKSGKIEKEVPVGFFPYAVSNVGGNLYVTLLGEDKLLVYSRELKLLKSMRVGKTPQEMCSDGRWLYVVNSGTDDLAVIDTRTNQPAGTISLAARGSRFGTTPTSCMVNDKRLYVTLAGTNQLAVLDQNTRKQIGLVPTGWYPTNVTGDDKHIFVLRAKGVRARRPNPEGPQPDAASRVGYVLTLLQGTAAVLDKDQLLKNVPGLAITSTSGAPVFDWHAGLKLPIKHIFYILKENRTYDQVLGDLGRGNGDKTLAIFGEQVTPVHHQLAREFVTLDNFFVNGEISVLGHSFTTSGYASPFAEWLGNNAYAMRWKGYPFGTVPAVTSPSYLWDILDEKQVDYRVYGENYFLFTRAYQILSNHFGAESVLAKMFYEKSMAAAARGDRGNEFYELSLAYYGKANTRADALKLLSDRHFSEALSKFLTGDESLARALDQDVSLRRKFADYLYHYPFNYRSWDLKYSDLDRVKAWKADFETQLRLGQVAQLHYIWLPNDHTDGTKERVMNPFQLVAQNDAALGRIIEIISHSSVWKSSLILVVEDDAQNGPDHVDATRTVALAAGPYVKRGLVVSDRYDQLSMLRTIEMLLGLKSLNLSEQLAVPMFGIFTDKPDFEPFVRTEPSGHLIAPDRQRDRTLAQ